MKKKICLFAIILLFVPLAMLFSACGNIEFKIKFIVDGQEYAIVNTAGNETISMPDNPTKEEYEFDGWYWDNNVWQEPFTANSLLNQPLNSDMKVYAKWIDSNEIKGTNANFVNFEKENESCYKISLSNSTAILNLSDYVEVANNSSWQLTNDIQGNNNIPSKMATLNIGDNTYYVLVTAQNGYVKLYTLTIRRRPIYTVSFGNYADTQYIEENGSAVKPKSNPIKTGYTFAGWNFDFSQKIIRNETIEATWTANNYNLKLNSNNNENIENIIQIDYDSYYFIPSNNYFTLDFYNLMKFNTKKDGTGISYNLNSSFKYVFDYDLTLYAIWSPINYSINYHYNNGTLVNNPTSYNIESNDIMLLNTSKDYYSFDGWYTEVEYQNKITTINKGSHGIINLYAKFSPISFDITYETYNIELLCENPNTYNIESPAINLLTGVYKDYNTTWLNENNIEITNIATGTFGDINLKIGFKDKDGQLYYPIVNISELTSMQNGNNYIILNDLDFNNSLVSSLLINPSLPYTGILDGNNCNLTNINLFLSNSSDDLDNLGLIGTNYGVIKNVNIKNINASIYCYNSNGHIVYMGCLVGRNENVIYNCSIIGESTINIQYSTIHLSFGSVVGYNKRKISDVHSCLNIATNSTIIDSGSLSFRIGGICAVNSDSGEIINSNNQGNINSTLKERASQSSCVGGICGTNSGIIYSSFNMGEITAEILTSYPSCSAFVTGGIVGNNFSSGIIRNCYTNANIKSYTNCSSITAMSGGISGKNVGSIVFCYSAGIITAHGKEGQFSMCSGISCGQGYIENCFSLSEIQFYGRNDTNIGGICCNANETRIINCYMPDDQKFFDISTNSYISHIYNNYGNIVVSSCLINSEYVISNINFGNFISNEDILQNNDNVWILENDKLPKLYWEN